MKLTEITRDKIILPLAKLLRQGLSPSKLALVISLGMTISVFPVLGIATPLCALVALTFRLNIVAIQMANYFAFPFQIILFFPFLCIGENISGISLVEISKSTLVTAFNTDYLHTIKEMSLYLILAIIGWFLAAVPLFLVIYYSFKFILNKYKEKIKFISNV